MGFAIRIADKTEPVRAERTGEVYPLYLRLLELMEDRPGDKLVVTFDTSQQAYRSVGKLNEWATEDGWELMTIPSVKGKQRHLWLEAKEA